QNRAESVQFPPRPVDRFADEVARVGCHVFGVPNPSRPGTERGLRTTRGTLKPNFIPRNDSSSVGRVVYQRQSGWFKTRPM
ncbi:hypothetical protein ACC862_38010, partial [Rhizobium ruizarguesonis]